jgi:hypothetical protein
MVTTAGHFISMWKGDNNIIQQKNKIQTVETSFFYGRKYMYIKLCFKIQSYFLQIWRFQLISFYVGPSWSWSYGSWIYNYLCNQCLSPLQIVSSNSIHGEVYSIQHYVINVFSNLWQVGGFFRVLRFPPPIKMTTTIHV